MNSMDDKFEEARYERSIKQNFALLYPINFHQN